MMNHATGELNAFALLNLLGIVAVVASIPVAFATMLWLPAIWDNGPVATVGAIAIVAAPVVQIAVLSRASDLNRMGRTASAACLIAVQLLTVTLVAAWMVRQ